MRVTTNDLVIFDGDKMEILSNMHQFDFVVEGNAFTSSEQLFMYFKAMRFGDSETAEQIISSTSPEEAKQLGRGVKYFIPSLWGATRYQCMINTLLQKVCHNSEFRKVLLETGDKYIAYASGDDKIWGIGLEINDHEVTNSDNWTGDNLLGYCMMDIRILLNNKPSTQELYEFATSVYDTGDNK